LSFRWQKTLMVVFGRAVSLWPQAQQMLLPRNLPSRSNEGTFNHLDMLFNRAFLAESTALALKSRKADPRSAKVRAVGPPHCRANRRHAEGPTPS